MSSPLAHNRVHLQRLWWLVPEWPLLLLAGGTMLAAYWQSDYMYSLYNTAKFIEGSDVLLVAVSIAVFALGRWLAMATGTIPEPSSAAADRIVLKWFYATSVLTALGYAVWLAVGVKNGFRPSHLFELLVTEDPAFSVWLRMELFPTIPGVTTCTEFGVPAAVMGVWLYFRGHKGIWPVVVSIVGIAAVRSVAFSERTALIVLGVPLMLMFLRMCVLGRWLPTSWCLGLNLAPVLSVVLLTLSFGGYEYFRSWRWYQDGFDTYSEFVAWRLSGYFTTAHNNGAMAMRVGKPREIPSYVLMPFWEFPLVEKGPFAYEKLTGVNPDVLHDEMLENYGTLELVNRGGMFQPALDFGLGGSMLFWFAYGFVAGRLYRSFLVGTLAGVTIYPILYFTILEAPLELYLSYPRMLPPFATLFVVSYCAQFVIDERRETALAPALN